MQVQKHTTQYILNLLHTGNASLSPMSWRDIAKLERFNGINFATLRAYAHGRPIKNKKHRAQLGLYSLVETEPCLKCGVAPAVCLCDGKKLYNPETQRPTAKPGTGRTRPPRVEIALSDLDHAAQRLTEITGRKWSYE